MKRKKKQKELPPVDVHNEEEMIALGYRNPLVPRDQTVWTKTQTEKNLLKKAKRMFKGYEFSSSWGFKKHPIPHRNKLIIQIYKNPNFMKRKGLHPSHTTFSYICGQSDIPEILNKFFVETKDGQVKSIVRKYKWNGKEYSSTELPFYYW